MTDREPPATPSAAAPAIDRRFIDDNRLVERYLDGKLPFKGARELEAWCRAHPEFLGELNLSQRTHASLRLLEAAGQPQDLREREPPWWRSPALLIALVVVSLASLVACWALAGKYARVSGDLEDARVKLQQGNLAAPGSQRTLRLEPDRSPDAAAARITVDRNSPQLLALHLAMGYAHDAQFRVIVDKRGQGRALVIDNLTRDSNGDLRIAFNTAALAPGLYDVRIESLPMRGEPAGAGWFVLDAH
jgi:hypothetical protein